MNTEPSFDPTPSLNIPLFTLRALFIASGMGLAYYLGRDTDFQFLAMVVAFLLALLVVAVDATAIARSDVSTVSAIVFGLLVGLLVGQLFLGILSLLIDFEQEQGQEVFGAIRLVVVLIFCYLGPAYLLRTKDDFRFIVPYVEFKKQLRGPKPLILDTSAVIDGRVVDLARGRLFDAPLVVPRFVIEELQRVADLSERSRRERGRRGLERLNSLRELPGIEVQLVEARYAQGDDVDRRLIEVARARDGKLVTTDYNLQKVCELEEVPVLNLHEIAAAMRPQYVPGEHLRLKIVRPGEGPKQGVGYLEDGTMVVVEGARRLKGRVVSAAVTSSIQSSAGRMLFARISGADEDASASSEPASASSGPAEEAEEPSAGEAVAPAGGGEERSGGD